MEMGRYRLRALAGRASASRPLAKAARCARPDSEAVRRRTLRSLRGDRPTEYRPEPFRPHFIRAEPNRRIAVAAKIDELEVWGKFRGSKRRGRASGQSFSHTLLLQARANAVLQQHVVGPIRFASAGGDRQGTADEADRLSANHARSLSIVPALESDAPTKLRPTGSNLPGGNSDVA